MKKSRFILATTALLMAALVSCEKEKGKEEPEPEPPTPTPVEVESVTLDIVKVDLKPGETRQLNFTVLPEDAEYTKVEWTSDNEEVATVEEGLVTAVAAGETKINVTVEGKSASCTITVKDGVITLPAYIYPGDFLLADGSILSKDTDEATVKEANVIGIVFTTDLERMGETEKEYLKEKGVIQPRGYAMAVKDATDKSVQWYLDTNTDAYFRDETEIGIPNIIEKQNPQGTFEKADADLDGFLYTKLIKEKRTADLEAGFYPVFKAVVDFTAAVPVPANATEWFVPSNGQFNDILRNLGGVTMTKEAIEPTNDEDFIFSAEEYVTAINNSLAKVNEELRSSFRSTYWTSSAVSETEARKVYTDDYVVMCMKDVKNFTAKVRPIIAFGSME